MNLLCVSLWAVAAAAACGVAAAEPKSEASKSAAEAKPARKAESKLTFPDVEGYKRSEFLRGVWSAIYNCNEPRIEVTFYAIEYGDEIPDGPDSDFLRAAMERSEDAIRNLVKRGIYRSVKRTSDGVSGLGTRNGAMRFLRRELVYVNDQGEWIAVRWLTGYRGRTIHVYCRYPAAQNAESEKAILPLLTALEKMLSGS